MNAVTKEVSENTSYSGAIKLVEIVSVEESVKKSYLMFKRVFDVVMSLLAGSATFILMLLIALLVRMDSPGPAIFKQERLGKDGKPFFIYKFRSMRIDAERDGPRWAEAEDERCTKIGRFLRNSRLDELPQLWNIFCGDMSFVGPRPERPYFYDKFETYIPGFRERLAVTPGLTGLAQINGGYDLKPEEKIVFDMEYIKNRSVKMDVICIIRTVSLVFTHKGAR